MEELYALALSFKRGVGFKRAKKLLEEYGSLEEGVREEIPDIGRELSLAEREIEKAERLGIRIVPFFSKEYPEKLLQVSQPPIVLYVKGNLNVEKSAAVVGSRRCSSYGRSVAFRLSRFLSERGVAVVSGLALGIDSQAHRGALNSGNTVAVLGSSVDLVYPVENRGLAERIVESGGAVVSEFPLGTRPKREYFPRRNRIVAGLSDCTVVVEATERSGTFITVNYALDCGRDVWAVPGNIDSPFSRGTNRLIKEGALPLTDFEELGDYFSLKEDKGVEVPEGLKEVYGILSETPLTADEIVERTGMSFSEVSSILLELQVLGLLTREGGVYRVC
ncbi:MAG: DNA-protecting protein DprA [Thermovibrio sp.]|nr:MAG: DNA-protecting protein DprA [Thermovibrio sp.]